jgi:Protein of unknown function (DUF2946)
MAALRRHRALIAWLAIVALLGNVAASLLAPAFAQPGAPDWPADLLGPQVICSEHSDQVPASGDGKAPQGPDTHCLMCLAAPALSFIAAVAAAVLLTPPTSRTCSALRLYDTLADRLRRAGLGSRAPPLPA